MYLFTGLEMMESGKFILLRRFAVISLNSFPEFYIIHTHTHKDTHLLYMRTIVDD